MTLTATAVACVFVMLAQVGGVPHIARIAIWLIVAIAVVGIVCVVIRYSGVNLPQWVWIIIGIVALAAFAIAAILFLTWLAPI